MSAGPTEPPIEGRDLAENARLVIGTTRAEFADILDDPPPWTDGHLTAIAWAIDTVEGKLLLVRHRVHGWSCPGGHVEPGETPSHTATRELREETALSAVPSRQPLTISSSIGCGRVPGARHWAVGYLFNVTAERTPQGEPGQLVRWFRLDDLPQPRTNDIDAVTRHFIRRN